MHWNSSIKSIISLNVMILCQYNVYKTVNEQMTELINIHKRNLNECCER